MKKFIFFALSISLLSGPSFAGEIISAESAHPITIDREITTHSDGQEYVSFELMQDGKPVQHLGKPSEVPLNWLQDQVAKQRFKAVGAVAPDVAAAWVGGVVSFGLAASAILVDGPVTALGFAGAAVGGWGITKADKTLSPRQHWKEAEAGQMAISGDLKLKNNDQVQKVANELASILNVYDTRTTGRIISDDVNEIQATSDQTRNAIDTTLEKGARKIYNGSIAAVRTVLSPVAATELPQAQYLSDDANK